MLCLAEQDGTLQEASPEVAWGGSESWGLQIKSSFPHTRRSVEATGRITERSLQTRAARGRVDYCYHSCDRWASECTPPTRLNSSTKFPKIFSLQPEIRLKLLLVYNLFLEYLYVIQSPTLAESSKAGSFLLNTLSYFNDLYITVNASAHWSGEVFSIQLHNFNLGFNELLKLQFIIIHKQEKDSMSYRTCWWRAPAPQAAAFRVTQWSAAHVCDEE